MKNKTATAKLSILLATLIWGTSFVVIKDTLDLITPNYLMALRFTAAFILLGTILWKKLACINRKMILNGAIIGVFLYLAYFWQTVGIMFTTPGKNAFLTAVYCVLVPFIAWFIRNGKPDRFNILAAFMCIAGIGLVSLDESLSMGKGDFFTLIGGFFFACHMVAVSKSVNDYDPAVMTFLQFGSAAVCFWITTLAIDGAPVPVANDAIFSVIYLAVFCTACALLLQNFGQKYTPPSVSALLLSLESVFGVLFSIMLGREELTLRMTCGFCVIFLAVIVSETKLSFLKKTKKS